MEKRTLCNRDCPDACGIVATISDESGKVLRLSGDPNHPVTRGFLCYRTAQFLKTQYSKERLTTPLVRRGGALEPAAWDEVIELLSSRLSEIRSQSGPEAIFHYRSGGSLGALLSVVDDFFDRFGPVTIKSGDICSGAGEAAQHIDFGVCDSSALHHLNRAKSIVLWGKNPLVSSPHTVPLLTEAKRLGAEMILVDPVAQRSGSLCDHVMQPRPGGDFALAMAVAQRLFDRGDVFDGASELCNDLTSFEALCRTKSVTEWCAVADASETEVEILAEAFACKKPCALLIGWGLGRRRFGGQSVRALDALSAISGNLGVPGGGASFYYQRRRAFKSSSRPEPPRTIVEPLFAQQVRAAEPPLRAIWVTAGNPVVMLPDSEGVRCCLEETELVVVVDSFLTDTAKVADVVLPTTTLLEADDLLGAYGHSMIGASTPVVAPPKGVKSDLEIIQALAAKLGMEEDFLGTAREHKQRLLSPALGERGVSLEDLEQRAVVNPLAPDVLFADGRVETPDGRVNLITQGMTELPERDPAYPLVLMAVSSLKSQSSQWVDPSAGPLTLTVHPDAAPELEPGAVALVESRHGSLKVKLRFDARQRLDIALFPKGGHHSKGQSANALIRGELTDLGQGGVLYDEPVRIRRISD